MEYDVVVVGGGAAGLMAACTAAQRGRHVLLLEKMDQAGRKLRITGKGRCNLTNTNPLRDTLPHIGSSTAGTTKKPGQSGGVWLRNAYGRFFAPELMEWFEQRGVELTVERGNRVYPSSGKALDIFLALISELENNPNVTIRKNTTVKMIETFHETSPLQATAVILERGERIPCRHIILATGGLSYPTTGSTGAGFRMARELGHTVVEPIPSLVALKCQEKIPEELIGFQLRNVKLTVNGHEFFGEMTFVPDGLAGPIVLSASRIVSRQLHSGNQTTTLTATLDLKPALSHIEYYKRLHQLTGEERRRLRDWLKGVRFTLTGTHDWNEAVVTQGGVSLAEVNPKTMESRIVSGLYIVGELLDLDADTGGYNLQIAFSTGHAAGEAV